jgi:acetate kinase
MNILALNAGSSSLKFRLLRIDGAEGAEGHSLAEGAVKDIEQVFHACASFHIDASAHRVVHGGPRLREPTRITDDVLATIRSASQLAPLHNDAALAGIEGARKRFPDAPAVAVFDTGFHQSIPEIAWRYALPRELADRHGLRRYGFHGISHRYVSERLLQHLRMPATGSRLIICHLGSGCSVCAVRDGKSIDTSMGFTPLEGLVMGTRCGDIDPGILLHLLDALRMPVIELQDLLNQRSGLLALSGRSGVPGSPDVRELEHAAERGDFAAEQALEVFAYRVRKYIGAYAAALGGLDALAFCGGVGEHSAAMRSRICRGLEFLGIVIDLVHNTAATGDGGGGGAQRISVDAADVQIWVLPTDEETQIAREAMAVLGSSPS